MVPENKQKIDTNKLTLLAFKIIAILHNTLSTHRTPLIWCPWVPDQREYRGLLSPHLNSFMKGACFADVAAIQERVTAVL
jgi:hypothetical protein